MATHGTIELLKKYRPPYTQYMSCVPEMADASQRGERPRDQVLAMEDRAFTDLAEARHALVQALVSLPRPHHISK